MSASVVRVVGGLATVGFLVLSAQFDVPDRAPSSVVVHHGRPTQHAVPWRPFLSTLGGRCFETGECDDGGVPRERWDCLAHGNQLCGPAEVRALGVGR